MGRGVIEVMRGAFPLEGSLFIIGRTNSKCSPFFSKLKHYKNKKKVIYHMSKVLLDYSIYD